MLTMKAIREKNYCVFDQDKQQKNLQSGTLKYLEYLAETANVDISEMKPEEFFLDAGGVFLTNKPRINEIFFSYMENLKRPKDRLTQEISDKDADSICKQFDLAFANSLESTIANQKNTIKKHEKEIEQFAHEISKANERFFLAKAQLDGIELKKKNGCGLGPDLKKILEEGWWSLSDSPKKGCISLITPEFRLSELNNKAAIAVSVNMGRIQVNVGVDGKSLTSKFEPYDNNPMVSDNFHPHIAPNGSLCLGSVAVGYAQSASTFNLTEFLNIIQLVLTSYNSSSPYIHLYQLEEASQKGRIFSRDKFLKSKKEILETIEANRFIAILPANEAQSASDVSDPNDLADDSLGEDEDSDDEGFF